MRKSGKLAAMMALAAAAMSSEQQRGMEITMPITNPYGDYRLGLNLSSANSNHRAMFLNQKQKRKRWRNAPHTRPSKNKR